MLTHFQNNWESPLQEEFNKEYYQNLQTFLKKEYQTREIFPPKEDIFYALHKTSLSQTKVCIIGQDPYHASGQANGLAFSVKPDVSIPPSLLNIYKELKSDLGYPIPKHGCLGKWADQGVLLLNTVLTVRAGEPGSHRNKGWEIFTGKLIKILNQEKNPIVFILWGRDAQKKQALISNPIHRIITSPHPSPLSAHRGFLGSRPFSKTNTFLIESGQSPIDWQIREN